MALQVPHAAAQASGGEEIFECSGDEVDQRILSEEKSIDRLSNYRESVRAKVQQSDENDCCRHSRYRRPKLSKYSKVREGGALQSAKQQ